jgi:2-methylisocitrate lyase-like PEP mutase family enzyme
MRLHERLRARPIVRAPGVWDALSALIAEAAGFEALFLSGSALGYSRLGRPDIGLVTATELIDATARIAERVAAPLFVDADSGAGNAFHVARLVRGLERAGAAAVQIEDQAVVKPSPAPQSRPLVPVDDMVGKIKAALDARSSDAFLVSARSDAPATEGFDGTLARCEAYVEAGCDLLFVEGLSAGAQLDRLARDFGTRVPLVHNLFDGGPSPAADAADLEARGFHVVLFPGVIIGAMARAGVAAAQALAQGGRIASVEPRPLGSKAMNELIGTAAFLADAKRY